jgi:hypothetical protein
MREQNVLHVLENKRIERNILFDSKKIVWESMISGRSFAIFASLVVLLVYQGRRIYIWLAVYY